MAIQKSAAAEIRVLIGDLGAADPTVRDAAVVRLSVIGVRAVPHLIEAFEALPSPIARSAILRALEATGDRRGIDIALSVLHSPSANPRIASAAVRLLGSHLDKDESDRALDALSALALDPAYRQALRLEALSELDRMPAKVIAPIRKWLAADPDAAVRMAAAGQAASADQSTGDPAANLERVAEGLPADPAALAGWVRAGAASVSLSTLHRLIELAGTREEQAPSTADGDEWRAARGALHLALARRGSRVAIYDLREAFARYPAHLPLDFVTAVGLVGDATCLEPVIAAIAASPIDLEVRNHQLHDSLIEAGRAIVKREGLTRRHAVLRKILKLWPDAGIEVVGPR